MQAVEGPGAAAMRAVQIVCWLLAAIYLFAALGSVVASGEVSTGAVELAVNAPALLVVAPVAGGRVAERTIEAGVWHWHQGRLTARA